MLTNLRDVFIGQSRSPNIVPFHILSIVSYCAIATLSLRRAICTIFNFKNVVTLKSWSEVIQGHWNFFSNFVPKTHCFWDIRLKKYCDLENRVRGPSSSLEMSPCDRAHTTSCLHSILTMAVSRVVSETLNVEKCRNLEIWVKGHSRSLKVVPLDRLCMVSY